ncbi:MAG: helix-turn-helix domain-containing protein [Nitrospinota bacterium]
MEKNFTQRQPKPWDQMDLGGRLRLIRQQLQQVNRRRYSLQSISRRTGTVSRQALSQIELGKVKNPTARVLSSVAADLGVTVGFLLTGAVEERAVRAEPPQGLKTEWEEFRRQVAEGLQFDGSLADEVPIPDLPRLKRLARGEFDTFIDSLANLRAAPGKSSETGSRLEIEVAALNRRLTRSEGRASAENWALAASLAGCLEEALGPAKREEKEEGGKGDSLLWKIRRLSRCLGQRQLSIVPHMEADLVGEEEGSSVRLEVDLADLALTVEYRGDTELPSYLLDEFKERIRFEWEMLLRRVR